MSNILVIQSSISGQESVSRALVSEAVARLLEANPGARVVVRDLGASPCQLGHEQFGWCARQSCDAGGARGSRALGFAHCRTAHGGHSRHRRTHVQLQHVLGTAKLRSITCCVPVKHSGTRPPVPRVSSGTSASSSSKVGAVFTAKARAKHSTFQEPYLRALFGFMGVSDLTFVRAEKIGYGPEAREASIASAVSEIAALTREVKAA